MSLDRHEVQQWLDFETELLLTTVGTFRRRDMREPTGLDDWSAGHLLTHLARNADALRNLVSWARTGVEKPMYESPTARGDDINRGALRSADIIVDDVNATAVALASDIRDLAEEDWQSLVRTAQGRTISAAEIPWLRLREVALHHVDLGANIEGLPLSLTTHLLVDVVKTLGAKPRWPNIALEANDSEFHHAGLNSDVFVSGTSAQLLGWLTGRLHGEHLIVDGAKVLPQLPNWL